MNKAIATITGLFMAITIVVSPSSAQANHVWEGPHAYSPALAVLLAERGWLTAPGMQDIVVEVTDADYSFGQHITFYLQASSPTTLTQANLSFQIQGQTDITIVPVAVEPGLRVSIEYPFSLVGQNVPPFALIDYWWDIQDETGNRQRSTSKQLYYADNRYQWEHLVHPRQDIRIVAHWVEGDISFGQAALNIANTALSEINRELKAPVPGDIRIYIYPSEDDLRSALNLGGYDWAGGQARPDLGAILVGIPNDLAAPGEMERLIPHELTHLLVYEAAGRTLGQVPPWLNEGLASANERRPDPNRQTLLEEALAQEHLIPLEALCAPFPRDQQAARLAYAQSADVVRYLREEYGSQAIRNLLAAYADGASCDAGVKQALGKSLTGLESAWRADLASQRQITVALENSAVWLALWILTILLALPLLGILRSGKQQSVISDQ